MADYYLHKTAAHIDELLEKVEGLDNYDDTEVRGLINNKVDKVTGKGLSTNDFTDAYKTDLDGLDTELNGKVDKETGKGLSTNDFTTEEKTKLAGIESGAQTNVQSDWNQTNTESKDFIKNKPTIPPAQVNADWNAESGVAQILHKPTIPDAQIQSDWNQNDTESKGFIKNKPTLGTASAKDYTTAVSGLSTDLITSAGVSEALSDKVDKVTGKGLSTNDFTNSYKETLDEISNTLNLKADLVDGKVPSSQLPSYVDDVMEYASASSFPATGESGKIYIAQDTNKTYRWGGSEYTEISESLALGETASTAYPGNKGKANADAIGTIANLTTTATDLVDAVNELNSGKVDKNGTDSLMTAAEHTKLSGIEFGAEVNVQSDWNQTDTTADDYIKNKPSIPSGVVVDQVYDGTSTNAQSGVAVAQAVSGKANSADLATVATSGSYADLSNKPTIPDELADLQDDSTHRVVTDAEKTAWSGKQAALVVGTNLDNTPVQGSTNPITSGAIYTGLAGKVDTNGTDSLMTAAEHTKLSSCKTTWKGTQAAYDLLPDHTSYDLYFIEEASS